MIKVDKNNTRFEGELPKLAKEVCLMIMSFKELCLDEMGEENGKDFYERTLSLANINHKELEEENKRAKKIFLKKILGIED